MPPWEAELPLVSWIQTALLLVTASMVFFHLTFNSNSTVEMPRGLAGFVAVLLSVLATLMVLVAMASYADRTRKGESNFRNAVMTLCIFTIVVLVVVSGVILKGATTVKKVQ